MGSPSLHLILKRDCPTCTLLEPVVRRLAAEAEVIVYSQDDPAFPAGIAVVDDRELERSYRFNIETVPTLLRIDDGQEVARLIGWDRAAWQEFTGFTDLGADLPAHRPGCGSRSVEPGMAELLALKFGDLELRARRIEIGAMEDEIEACFDRGWSDGLPVVPPTAQRVARMLGGTARDPHAVVGIIPPNNVPCTVEKVAINAVLAGCKPEYLPVVLAAVEAACLDQFCMHGLLATTWFSGPIVVVNGPVARAIGMNSGVNALGQGNRANATIGRALQLVIRNIGGGIPGGVDRSTLGNPGKYTFCFAEKEVDSAWSSLAVERGFGAQQSTVTLFAGDGVQGVYDQLSREPDSLTRSFAMCLRAVAHPKLAMGADAMLVISPEHLRIFAEAGWSKQRFRTQLDDYLHFPGAEMVRRHDNVAEGLPESFADRRVPKFRPGGLHIVHAGGEAGLFSAIIGGWVASGPKGSEAVTVAVDPG